MPNIQLAQVHAVPRTAMTAAVVCRYFIVKLIIPVIACVAFAFTAFAIAYTELAARLTVVVPAAIALTALQVQRCGPCIMPTMYK